MLLLPVLCVQEFLTGCCSLFCFLLFLWKFVIWWFYCIIMGVWSELSSRLGVIFSLFVFSPLVTAKSRRSGFLFRSVGQYVGVPVDNILRLLFLMYFSSVLPRGVVFLNPHSVCFELQSPAAMYLSPRCWKYSSHIFDVILCRGGTHTTGNWK